MRQSLQRLLQLQLTGMLTKRAMTPLRRLSRMGRMRGTLARRPLKRPNKPVAPRNNKLPQQALGRLKKPSKVETASNKSSRRPRTLHQRRPLQLGLQLMKRKMILQRPLVQPQVHRLPQPTSLLRKLVKQPLRRRLPQEVHPRLPLLPRAMPQQQQQPSRVNRPKKSARRPQMPQRKPQLLLIS